MQLQYLISELLFYLNRFKNSYYYVLWNWFNKSKYLKMRNIQIFRTSSLKHKNLIWSQYDWWRIRKTINLNKVLIISCYLQYSKLIIFYVGFSYTVTSSKAKIFSVSVFFRNYWIFLLVYGIVKVAIKSCLFYRFIRYFKF